MKKIIFTLVLTLILLAVPRIAIGFSGPADSTMDAGSPDVGAVQATSPQGTSQACVHHIPKISGVRTGDALERGCAYYIADGTCGVVEFNTTVDGGQYITITKATEADHGTDTGWDPSWRWASGVSHHDARTDQLLGD